MCNEKRKQMANRIQQKKTPIKNFKRKIETS